MRRFLKWMLRPVGRDRGGGGRIVRLVRVVAGAQHSRAGTSRRIRLARPGLGRRAERAAAPALLLHRAGHLDAAGRLRRCSALRLVRESRAAAVAGTFRRAGSHAPLPLPRRPGAERQPIPTSCPSASRAISIRASARTCSTSPARPATRARFTSPGTARPRAIRIDGGPAMHAFTDMSRGSFAPMLLASLSAPRSIPGSSTASPKRCSATVIRDAKPAAQEGAVRHHQGHARQRPEQSAAQAVSRCTKASAAPTRSAASATPRSAITSPRLTTRSAMRR